MQQNYWRKCSVCKSEIGFDKIYYVCSVSSCNLKRSPNQFCSVTCWDSHNAVMNHMSAGADEERSPKSLDLEVPRRRIVVSKPSDSVASPAIQSSSNKDVPLDILVVVSKLKAYINARSDMNTSADVMPILSDYLRRQCDAAIENARRDGRKTVMARDF